MTLNYSNISNTAYGRWSDLLQCFGIDSHHLDGKHRACPACGGKDRFRFINEGKGSFICSQGGGTPLAGDGFTLLEHVYRWDSSRVLREVADYLNVGSTDSVPPPVIDFTPIIDSAKQRKKLSKAWSEAKPVMDGDPVDLYLSGRGLGGIRSDSLRFHAALPYWQLCKQELLMIGRYPAMVGLIESPAGVLMGLHRTYLDIAGNKAVINDPLTGESLPVKKMQSVNRGATMGAAIQLQQPQNGRLAIAEGIETALAITRLKDWPCWAGVSAEGLKRIELPDSVDHILIGVDRDKSGTGQRVALELIEALEARGLKVDIALPDTLGLDWADVAEVVA